MASRTVQPKLQMSAFAANSGGTACPVCPNAGNRTARALFHLPCALRPKPVVPKTTFPLETRLLHWLCEHNFAATSKQSPHRACARYKKH